MLQLGHQTQRMGIVIEAAERRRRRGKRFFAGMAERRVAEVVRQRDRLGQILVQRQHPRDGAGDLRHFQRMGHPRAVIIAFVLHEDLRLVLEAAERGGMDDAVAVALVTGARRAFGLGIKPPRLSAGLVAKCARAVGGEYKGGMRCPAGWVKAGFRIARRRCGTWPYPRQRLLQMQPRQARS